VFVLYALVLTVATHWPALALGTEQQPAPDKLLHMLVFGGLVILLWRARWVRPAWLVVLLILVWVVVDELTQGMPILRRNFSWQDMVAGQLGVILVGAWWWALGPTGGAPNRLRLAYQAFIVTDLCARRRAWLLAVAAGLGGGAVFGVAAWLVFRAAGSVYGNPGNVIVAVIVGAVAAAQVTLAAMFGPRARALADHRPCFACGGSCHEAPFGEAGRGRCPSCGLSIHRGQWSPPMQLPMSAALRGAGRAGLAAVGLIALAVGLYSVLLMLSMRLTVAKDLLGVWQRISLDMRLAVDLTLVGLALAMGMRIYRSRQARLHDRQHLECRSCGHDLTGTTVTQGLGTCPECGAGFAKII
jgi:ribosomal protein L37AE/L43A